jgi:hypothetical protein
VLALLALLPCTGCAVIGAGIGSTIPKYEPLSREPVTNRASVGQELRIVRASDGREISGRYEGAYDDKLWVRTPEKSSSVDVGDVKSAKVVADNHWLEGFLIGLGVDVAVLAVVGANIGHLFPKTNTSLSVGADGVNVAGR